MAMNTMNELTPDGENDPQAPLSLREAARLSGVPREYLEECVASGVLGVHLHHKGDATRFRVTRTALVAAGILPRDPDPPMVDPNEQLVGLLKTQTERLAAIEEQRFQLAGQLGAALERNRILEERMLVLAAASRPDDSIEPPPSKADAPTAEHAAKGSAMHLESPSSEPSPPAPVKLAVRIIRLKPAGRWSARAFSAIPGIGSLIDRKLAGGAK